jgi:hypothetical protein
MNIVYTFKHFISEQQAQACGKTTDTLLLDYIGFSLNAENPDTSMECRSTYPPIMRCSFSTSSTSVGPTFRHLLEQCVAPPDNALICDLRLQHINEIKQIIIQTGRDDFCTYVRETAHSNRWYKFNARDMHFHNMEVPLCDQDIDISQARHCWACTASLLDDADVIHNAMMENVRQSMRRYIVQQVALRVGHFEMPTSSLDENASSSTHYNIEDNDFIDEQEVPEVNPDDVEASIGNMERFLDTASWDPQALRQAIIDMDIGEGDKQTSGDIVVDSGEDGVPVFDYENRPFTDRETGEDPFDTVGYTFPHLFPDGKCGFNEERAVKVKLSDWVSHLLHFCEVVEQDDETFKRVRRFATAIDFCFWLENKIQIRRASGIAFIAGDRARQRGIVDPLGASAVNSADLLVAIRAAKAMTDDEFAAVRTGRSGMSLTH